MGGKRTGRKRTGVRAISDSSIEITFHYRGVRCRERLKIEPSPANLDRAADHRSAILLAIKQKTFDYTVTFPNSKRAEAMAPRIDELKGVTLGRFLAHWIVLKEKELKVSTFNEYQKVVMNQIIPALGHIEITALRRKHVKEWCRTMTCSNKRIANILSPLRSALDEALEDEIIDQNPLSGWTYSYKEPLKEDHVDPFTKEEQAVILEHMSGQVRNYTQFAIWTGLRTSELVELKWGDIDWVNGKVRVRRARTQRAQKAEDTKTKSGRRDVKLLSPALEALQRQKEWTYLQDEHVFHNPNTNQPWSGDHDFRRTHWLKTLKRAGVAYRNPYQTRHTYASMMLSSGEHPMWVAQQMGHSDWTMIAKRYGKWMPDANPLSGHLAVELYGDEVGKGTPSAIPSKTG